MYRVMLEDDYGNLCLHSYYADEATADVVAMSLMFEDKKVIAYVEEDKAYADSGLSNGGTVCKPA